MTNFNWDRFYDELEEADPKKFPYHIWVVHELVCLFEYITAGLVLGAVVVVVMLSSVGVIASYLDKNPDVYLPVICEAYLKSYD